MPADDKGRSVERLHAAELALEAKIHRVQREDDGRVAKILNDKQRNIERIRESMDGAGVGGTKPSCKRCGDPYSALLDGLCPSCQRDAKLDGVRDKMSPEELYPDETEREEHDV